MTTDRIEKQLTEEFLPRIQPAALVAGTRAGLSVSRLKDCTTTALAVFDRAEHPATVWGYCSAFNPLAYVETIMPPHFHYLIQIERTIIDPIRTALLQKPIHYNIDSEDDQMRMISAYGHPSRW